MNRGGSCNCAYVSGLDFKLMKECGWVPLGLIIVDFRYGGIYNDVLLCII